MADYTLFLGNVLQLFSCETGTIHRTTSDGENLEMLAQIGVPEQLLPIIANIPFGKGIAGAAAATKAPVQLCNLQKDLGGVAKEGARSTGVCGSLAVPILSENGQQVLGVIGIGKHVPYDFSPEEEAALYTQAADLAKIL